MSQRASTNRFASVSMRWGYSMLVLSILFNGLRYNLESAAMKADVGSAQRLSPWDVIVIGSYAGAAGFFIVAWIWRRLGWTWGSLEQVSWASCVHTAKAQGWLVLLAALAASSGGWLITQANKLYGPEFTAFLGNLIPVFLVLTGLAVGERLRRAEVLAVVVTIAGAFMFSYQHGHVNWAGIGLMVSGCLIMSGKKTLMKHATGVGNLPSVMTLSLVLTATWSLVGGFSSGGMHLGSLRSFSLCVGGGLAGAMIGMSLLYAGLNVVGLVRGGPIDSLRPLAVLIFGLLSGTALPARFQLIGGAMVLLGSAALAKLGPSRAGEKVPPARATGAAAKKTSADVAKSVS